MWSAFIRMCMCVFFYMHNCSNDTLDTLDNVLAQTNCITSGRNHLSDLVINVLLLLDLVNEALYIQASLLLIKKRKHNNCNFDDCLYFEGTL